MKKILFLILLLAAQPAQAAVNVFACEPEWKSLAEEIGRENVKAFSATSYRQDPHHVRAKPSLLANMRSADLIICSGAGLEVGWLPVLMQKSARSSAEKLMAADYVDVIGKRNSVDRSMGDVHPEGNPHIQLNPYNILKVGAELTSRFESIDPENKVSYRKNWQEFEGRWKLKTKEWEREAASLKGQAVIVHHESWDYLLGWLGIRQVASLEPKPGVPPTTGHLESLLNLKAAAIIRAPFNSDEASNWLSEKTGIPAIVLPFTVNSEGEPKDLFQMFDQIISGLKNAQR